MRLLASQSDLLGIIPEPHQWLKVTPRAFKHGRHAVVGKELGIRL
jgi:hypothetical protein